MLWQINVQEKKPILVEFPATLPAQHIVTAEVEGSRYRLRWDPSLGTLFLAQATAESEFYLEQPWRLHNIYSPEETQGGWQLEIPVPGTWSKIDILLHAMSHLNRQGQTASTTQEIKSPITGTVIKVAVEPGATVPQGSLLMVVEAMKMENRILAPKAGKVESVLVQQGGKVTVGQKLCKLSL